MPKANKVTVSPKGQKKMVKVSSKSKLGGRTSSLSAFMMSTEALLEFITGASNRPRDVRKATNVLIARGAIANLVPVSGISGESSIFDPA